MSEEKSREIEILEAAATISGFALKNLKQLQDSRRSLVFDDADFTKSTAIAEQADRILKELESDLISGAVSTVVLEFVQEQVTGEIKKLSKIVSSEEKRANLEKVREIGGVAKAHKLLRETSSQDLALAKKKVNT